MQRTLYRLFELFLFTAIILLAVFTLCNCNSDKSLPDDDSLSINDNTIINIDDITQQDKFVPELGVFKIGESGMIKELNLTLPENSVYVDKVLDIFSYQQDLSYKTEYYMTDKVKIALTRLSDNEMSDSLYYINDETGEIRLLVKGVSREEGGAWGLCRYPVFFQQIDENIFVYQIGGYEQNVGCGIYDISDFTGYYINGDSGFVPLKITEDTLYIYKSYYGDGAFFDLTAVDLSDKNYTATKLLAEFLSEDSPYQYNNGDVSPDGKYYIRNGKSFDEEYIVELYSIVENKYLMSFNLKNITPFHYNCAKFSANDTIYVYNDNTLVEIKF